MTKEHPLIWLWLGAVTLQIYRVPVDHLSTSYGGLDHPRPAIYAVNHSAQGKSFRGWLTRRCIILWRTHEKPNPARCISPGNSNLGMLDPHAR